MRAEIEKVLEARPEFREWGFVGFKPLHGRSSADRVRDVLAFLDDVEPYFGRSTHAFGIYGLKHSARLSGKRHVMVGEFAIACHMRGYKVDGNQRVRLPLTKNALHRWCMGRPSYRREAAGRASRDAVLRGPTTGGASPTDKGAEAPGG